jgi:hypothetical protein
MVHRAITTTTILLAFAAVGVARAGGIADEYTRLTDSFGRGGRAMLVQVSAVDGGAPAIEAQVLKTWSRAGNTDEAEDGVRRFELMSGPDTSDAHEWVVHVHYWNDTYPSQVGLGQQVLLVTCRWGGETYELVAATEETLARVARVAESDFPEGYQQRATLEQLERDLADFDLYDAAYGGLVARGALRHEAVLAAAEPLSRYLDLLRYHLEQLPADQHAAFYVALAATIPATGSTNHGWRFDKYLADAGYTESTIPVLLAMAEATERREGHDSSLLNRHVEPVVTWLQTPTGARHAKQLAPLMLAWIRVRSSRRCDDPAIGTYLGLLKGRDRKTFIDKATPLVTTSSCAMGQTDDFLAGVLAE